jgi:flagellar biosynthesis component FlhA
MMKYLPLSRHGFDWSKTMDLIYDNIFYMISQLLLIGMCYFISHVIFRCYFIGMCYFISYLRQQQQLQQQRLQHRLQQQRLQHQQRLKQQRLQQQLQQLQQQQQQQQNQASTSIRETILPEECTDLEYCFDCIHEWSDQNRTCPACRARFTKISRRHRQRRQKGEGGPPIRNVVRLTGNGNF